MDNKELISEMFGIATSVESAEKIIRNNEATMSSIQTASMIAYLIEEITKLNGHDVETVQERIKRYKEDYIKQEAQKLYEHWQEVGRKNNN